MRIAVLHVADQYFSSNPPNPQLAACIALRGLAGQPCFNLVAIVDTYGVEALADVNSKLGFCFQMTNHIDSSWQENDRVTAMGEAKKSARSTSVGDVFVLENGDMHVVLGMGFRKVSYNPRLRHALVKALFSGHVGRGFPSIDGVALEVTEERYHDARDVLPPIAGRDCFAMGEAKSHTDDGRPVYYWFTRRGSRYFCVVGTREVGEAVLGAL